MGLLFAEKVCGGIEWGRAKAIFSECATLWLNLLPADYESLPKCRLFRSNRVKTAESLRLCRLFKLFHPGIEKSSQKDAQSQAFHHYAYSQDKKDAYSQELGEINGREVKLTAWAEFKRLQRLQLLQLLQTL
ncbi:hypothetical protein, partial [Paenibacillus alba]